MTFMQNYMNQLANLRTVQKLRRFRHNLTLTFENATAELSGLSDLCVGRVSDACPAGCINKVFPGNTPRCSVAG